jgi:hypothetical protein
VGISCTGLNSRIYFYRAFNLERAMRELLHRPYRSRV